MGLKDLKIDSSWSLFLDRDGVINRKLPDDYVKKISEFAFIPGSAEAIAKLSGIFGNIVVVTNQQGIGKKIMQVEDLNIIHQHMLQTIQKLGGRIDKIYYCPELAEKNHIDRKPNTGMAQRAKKDFPQIDFKRSIMLGDSYSDLQFGATVGMKTVFIAGDSSRFSEEIIHLSNFIVTDLMEFSKRIHKD